MLDAKQRSSYIRGMNKMPLKTRALILNMLCEGQSMRATARLADVSFNTVAKLLIDAGKVCADLHDELVQGVTASRIQCDEIWSFTYAKQKNVPTAKAAPAEAGDTWTWTALDSDSKLIVSWLVGGRDSEYAIAFMDDLRSRLANRVQLTTDGHKAYLEAVEGAFGGDVDYAQLIKLYGDAPQTAARYSPRSLHRSPETCHRRPAGAKGCLDQPCRAAQSDHADADAPVHPADECVLQEVREPHAHGRALHRLVQLHPHSQVPADHPGHGSRSEQDRLGYGRLGADHGRAGSKTRSARPLQESGRDFKVMHYLMAETVARMAGKRLMYRELISR